MRISKKLLSILCCLMFILVVPFDASASTSNDAQSISDYDIFVSMGVCKIKLPGNPTTGYTWSYEIADTNIVKLVDEDYKANSDLAGSSGIFTYNFKGVKHGSTDITFTYARSWEPDSYIYKMKFKVATDSQNKIVSAYYDDNESIHVTVYNGKCTFALKSNPSTGYSWSVDLSDAPKNCFIITEDYISSATGTGKGAVTGAGGTTYITFKTRYNRVIKPKVTFSYARSWDPNSTIDKQTYQIGVSYRKIKSVTKIN